MLWDINNDQEKRIRSIVDDLKTESDMHQAWLTHIQQVFTVPFKARVIESQEQDSVRKTKTITTLNKVGEFSGCLQKKATDC